MSTALASEARGPSIAAVAAGAATNGTGVSQGTHGRPSRHVASPEPTAVAEMRPTARLVRVSLSKEAHEAEPAKLAAMAKAAIRPAPKLAAEKAKPVAAKAVARRPAVAEASQHPAPRRVARAQVAPSYLGGSGGSAKRAATSQFVPTSSSASASSHRSGMWQRMTLEGQ